MANRVFSVAAIVLGVSAVTSCLAVTPAAAAWTHHRHVRSYGYTPAHYVTVVRHSTVMAILSLCTTTIRHMITDTDLAQ